jgi:hypothetical protein
MGWDGSTYGRRGVSRVLVGIPEKKRTTWKTQANLVEDNIKIDLQEVEWEVMDWIDLTQGRDRKWAVVNAVLNLRVL